MKIVSRFRPLLAALALAGLAGVAHADILRVSEAPNASDIAIIQAPSYEGMVKRWAVENETLGDSFLAYCLELLAPTDEGNPHDFTRTDYTPNDNVRALYDRFYAQSLDSRDQSVGFQLALWQLSGELSDLSLVMTGYDGADVARQMVSVVLGAETDYERGQYRYYRWVNEQQQDILQVVPERANEVPEPQTHALLLGGLGLMAVRMASRRRQQAKG